MVCMRYRPEMDFVHPIEAVIPGAQGRVLAVLVETTAELNLRTLARLAGVSVAQASRVLPRLVELGLVERREVPPSSQFRLVRSHVAARAVIELSRSGDTVLKIIGDSASRLPVPPASVIVFGSFARGEAGAESDLDICVVRPNDIGEDHDSWGVAIEGWRNELRAITGNSVELLEVSRDEAASRLAGNRQVWREIRREGVVVHGLSLAKLSEAVHA